MTDADNDSLPWGLHLHEVVRAQLRALILDGTLLPGGASVRRRRRSRAVAGVSLKSVYSALIGLQLKGFLDLSRRSARVVIVDPRPDGDYQQALGLLRAGALELAVPVLSPAATAEFSDLVPGAGDASQHGPGRVQGGRCTTVAASTRVPTRRWRTCTPPRHPG